jgi:Gram-negative bacterial TonB protein C-terminal
MAKGIAAVSASIALHAAVLLLAVQLRRRPEPLQILPIEMWRTLRGPRVAPPSAQSGRQGSLRGASQTVAPRGEVRLPEREIIDQGHGITMTIDAAEPSPDAGTPEPARWLSMDVLVEPPLVPPRPSPFCVPEQPRMPALAVEHDITGRVDAEFVVDDQGVVVQMTFEPGAPSILQRSVREWLRGCLFTPAQQGGRRAAAHVRQAFLFEVH